MDIDTADRSLLSRGAPPREPNASRRAAARPFVPVLHRVSGVVVACALCAVVPRSAIAEEAASYVIIVNAEHPDVTGSSETVTLTKALVSRAFLGKHRRWSGNVPVAPVDRSVTSAIREAFSREIHGKSARAIFEYWKREIFAARASPPPVEDSDADVVAYVASRPGGIGYVSPDWVLPDTVIAVAVKE